MRRLIQNGKPVLVLKVWGQQEMDGYDVAVVPLSPDFLNLWIGRVDAFRAAFAADKDVASIEYWDYAPDYFPGDYEQDDEATDDGSEEVPLPGKHDDEYAGRTEVDRMGADSEGVCWTAYIKNTDAQLTTETITYDRLLALRDELQGGK